MCCSTNGIVLAASGRTDAWEVVAAGVVEIHDAGGTLFQSVRARVKDADTKSQAAALGLKIFPDALEEQSTLVRT
jgi:hypothetical protein